MSSCVPGQRGQPSDIQSVEQSALWPTTVFSEKQRVDSTSLGRRARRAHLRLCRTSHPSGRIAKKAGLYGLANVVEGALQPIDVFVQAVRHHVFDAGVGEVGLQPPNQPLCLVLTSFERSAGDGVQAE